MKSYTIILRRNPISSALETLFFVSQSLILLLAVNAEIRGQRTAQPSPHERVLDIQRIERDQQLLLKPIPPKKEDNSVRIALLKQSKEDFRTLQTLNNKMMADAWAKDELNYNSISDSLSQIRSKATRLKSNLSLPQPGEDKDVKDKPSDLMVSNDKDFRSGLLRLDKSIMSFVTNPTFKESTVVEVSLAKKASQDLEDVINLIEHLQKAGKSLNKKPSDTKSDRKNQ